MSDELTLDVGLDPRLPTGLGGRWYGVHPALVCDVRDPEGQGRVKVSLPWAVDPAGGAYEVWARLATLMAGPGRGTWLIPDVGDEVLVAFQGGDPRRPYVIGALWNGRDAPPQTMDGAGSNDHKLLRTRSGVQIALDDTAGQESLVLSTPGGQTLTLRDGPGSVTIADAHGNTVKLDAGGVTVTSAGNVTVEGAAVKVSAASLTVDAGMSTFSGVVKADTVIATSVVGTSYTPGAGNIW